MEASNADRKEGPVQLRLETGGQVEVQCGETVLTARVTRVRPGTVQLAGRVPPDSTIGTPLVIRSGASASEGRLAAIDGSSRYVVALHPRPIRRSPRRRVDLALVARHSLVAQELTLRVVDLSEHGARIQGWPLPTGMDVTLEFIPPGQRQPVVVRGVVVRAVEGASPAEVGVDFVTPLGELREAT